MMGFAEFIIGPVEGRARRLYPSCGLRALRSRTATQGALKHERSLRLWLLRQCRQFEVPEAQAASLSQELQIE